MNTNHGKLLFINRIISQSINGIDGPTKEDLKKAKDLLADLIIENWMENKK
tara:strand:- start:167 stop:319 length:153 start_codon:yes stop_codon:yes gene_type:complete